MLAHGGSVDEVPASRGVCLDEALGVRGLPRVRGLVAKTTALAAALTAGAGDRGIRGVVDPREPRVLLTAMKLLYKASPLSNVTTWPLHPSVSMISAVFHVRSVSSSLCCDGIAAAAAMLSRTLVLDSFTSQTKYFNGFL
eukprot:4519670-Amphidinium_carterae.1